MERKITSEIILLPILIVFLISFTAWNTFQIFEEPFYTILIVIIELLIAVFFCLIILEKRFNKNFNKYKLSLILLLGFFVFSTAFFAIVYVRLEHSPDKFIHDGALQAEIAANMILDGKNPYVEEYYDTAIYDWGEGNGMLQIFGVMVKNPALEHYIYLPLNFLSVIPLEKAFNFFHLKFDYRFILYAAWIIAIVFLLSITKKTANKLRVAILFVINPLIINHIIFGMNEIYILVFMIAAVAMLFKKKYLWATLLLGLACVIKQTIWFFLPFYFIWLYFKLKKQGRLKKDLYKHIIILVITFLVFTLPFMIWDFNALIEDTILFPIGKTELIHPINGYGLSNILFRSDVLIHDILERPNWLSIVQYSITIPLFILFAFLIKRNPKISRMILLFSVWIFVYWFFSRYFNTNYLIFFLAILIISRACELREQENEKGPTKSSPKDRLLTKTLRQ